MDARFMASRSVNMRTWVKTSHAPPIRKVYAIGSSSAYSDPFDLFCISECSESISPYGFWRDTHEDVCDDIKEWICDMFSIGDDERDTRVRINCPLPTDVQANALWTTKRKNPDVAYYSEDGELLVQIEVLSTDRDTALFKLALGLSDQSRYERNLDSRILVCTGFFFPVGTGVVERVDCRWNDEEVNYSIKCSEIRKEDLDQTFCDVIQLAETKIRSTRNSVSNNFTLPMTEQYVHATFGPTFFQIRSGDSVVLMSRVENKVYKYPLSKEAVVTLGKAARTMRHLRRTAIPIGQPGVTDFFTFEAYEPPLTRSEARAHIVPLVSSVVEAIKELHTYGRKAHLDIKLDNICFDANNQAILIDIDRSQMNTKMASGLFVRYSRAEMYRCPMDTWTCENLDWKQLGLLIEDVIQSTERHDFIHKLVDCGEYDGSAHASWSVEMEGAE